MRLPTSEFIRRFLTHVLPSGFHRIRHAGFLANGIRRDRIEKIRRLIDTEPEPDQTTGEDGRADADERDPCQKCPRCGGAMRIIETFTRGQTPKSRAPPWGMPHDPPITPGAAIPMRRTRQRGQPTKTSIGTGP